MIRREYLYIIAASIWGMPGINITIKGINAYLNQPSENIWFLLMITAGVLSCFFIMFRRIVNRYCERIAALPDKVKVWQVFPARGWILIVFMMGLGIILNYIPDVPMAFTASFYSGLGPILIVASLRFVAAKTHR